MHDYLWPIFDATLLNPESRILNPHLAIALSGGVDSMALLCLLQQWGKRPLLALTVDHQLRAGSRAEAETVQAWCVEKNIAHRILTPSAAAIANVQTRARTMRYNALTRACASDGIHTLALAHHADDQAETVALQQHRGDSPPSRAGMAVITARGGTQLVRPLLGVRKQTLVAYLQAHAQPWLNDPSNASDAYARNRLRKTMTEANFNALWLEAQQQGDARHRDDLARNRWFAAHARVEGTTALLEQPAWCALPEPERSDVLSHSIRCVGRRNFRPRHHETARLVEALIKSPTGKATLGHCLIRWNATAVSIAPEHALDSAAGLPHIFDSAPSMALGNEPFRWFPYPLFDNGALRAAHQ